MPKYIVKTPRRLVIVPADHWLLKDVDCRRLKTGVTYRVNVSLRIEVTKV